MFKRLWAKLKDLQITSNRKYHFIMMEVYAIGIAEGVKLAKTMMSAEANGNRGCILESRDAKATVAEVERMLREGRR